MQFHFEALRHAAAFAILDRPGANPRFRARMARTWSMRPDFYIALATQLHKLGLKAEGLVCAR